MAERSMISRNTLGRLEKGDPSVSMGIYATVFFVLGMTDKLAALADFSTDEVARSLEEAALPTRIRPRRSETS
jgi:transcriptional regulator with XRE-family HTH domain